MLKRHLLATVMTAIFLEWVLSPTGDLVTRFISRGPCGVMLAGDPAEPILNEVYLAVRAERLKHVLSVVLALLALATSTGIQELQRRGAMGWWVLALGWAALALLSTLPLLQCRLGLLLAGPVWVVTLAVVVMWAVSTLLYRIVFSLSAHL